MGCDSTTMSKQSCGKHLGRLRSESPRRVSSGQALVEFALASLVFLMIVFGTLDFGRAIYQYSQLHNAVREGARVAKVDPTGTAAIRQKVRDTGVGLNLADANINVCCGSNKPGDMVTVTATYHFNLITGSLLGITVPPLDASASVMIE